MYVRLDFFFFLNKEATKGEKVSFFFYHVRQLNRKNRKKCLLLAAPKKKIRSTVAK